MNKSLAVLFALLVSPQSAVAQTLPDSVLGVWLTPIAEQTAAPGGPSAFVRERIEFGPSSNVLKLEALADIEAQIPVFTYESSGPYKTLGPSESVEGALLLNAENETSTVTIFQDVPEIWSALNLAACPLEIGVAVAIAECVSGPPLNSARCTELDLVQVNGNELRLGARDTDRCVTRPTALGDTIYFRE